MATGYKFPIRNSDGTASSSKVDMEDMMVPKDQFLTAGLWAWGMNNSGALGNGNTINYSSPVQVGALTNWKQISSGQYHFAAIKTDGTLWTGGDNGTLVGNVTAGVLGNGTTVSYSSPIQVGLLSNWKQVSTHFYHMAAIKTDGTLWTCGYNSYGQLGNNTSSGTASYYSSPIQVGSLTNWKQVSAGWLLTLAIKTDGTLWGWGRNDEGSLGNGTTIKYSSPIQIGSLTNWKQVASRNAVSLAIKTDGTLWGWGRNDHGCLGNGTTVNYSSPVQIGSLNNWKQVSADIASAAIKTDGTLWTWGYNGYGGLGNGTPNIKYSSPIQIGSLTNWKQVACGNYNFAAIKTDGTLWVSGYNGYGQLGNGNTIDYSSPIQIGSLTNWKQVEYGGLGIRAIQAPDYYYNQ